MEPGKLDLRIIKNRTFQLHATPKFDGVVFDNTGYAAHMQVRDRYDDLDILLDLHSDSGEIVLGGADGSISITADANLTNLLAAPNSAYWDLVLILETNPNRRIPILEGEVTVDPAITR